MPDCQTGFRGERFRPLTLAREVLAHPEAYDAAIRERLLAWARGAVREESENAERPNRTLHE